MHKHLLTSTSVVSKTLESMDVDVKFIVVGANVVYVEVVDTLMLVVSASLKGSAVAIMVKGERETAVVAGDSL